MEHSHQYAEHTLSGKRQGFRLETDSDASGETVLKQPTKMTTMSTTPATIGVHTLCAEAQPSGVLPTVKTTKTSVVFDNASLRPSSATAMVVGTMAEAMPHDTSAPISRAVRSGTTVLDENVVQCAQREYTVQSVLECESDVSKVRSRNRPTSECHGLSHSRIDSEIMGGTTASPPLPATMTSGGLGMYFSPGTQTVTAKPRHKSVGPDQLAITSVTDHSSDDIRFQQGDARHGASLDVGSIRPVNVAAEQHVTAVESIGPSPSVDDQAHVARRKAVSTLTNSDYDTHGTRYCRETLSLSSDEGSHYRRAVVDSCRSQTGYGHGYRSGTALVPTTATITTDVSVVRTGSVHRSTTSHVNDQTSRHSSRGADAFSSDVPPRPTHMRRAHDDFPETGINLIDDMTTQMYDRSVAKHRPSVTVPCAWCGVVMPHRSSVQFIPFFCCYHTP